MLLSRSKFQIMNDSRTFFYGQVKHYDLSTDKPIRNLQRCFDSSVRLLTRFYRNYQTKYDAPKGDGNKGVCQAFSHDGCLSEQKRAGNKGISDA